MPYRRATLAIGFDQTPSKIRQRSSRVSIRRGVAGDVLAPEC
jgi:hypothetical protein